MAKEKMMMRGATTELELRNSFKNVRYTSLTVDMGVAINYTELLLTKNVTFCFGSSVWS